MKKITILKYIEGTATREERKEVLDWMEKSEENQRYFAEQKNIWVQLHLPRQKADEASYKAIERKLHIKPRKRAWLYLQRVAAVLFLPLLATALYLLLNTPAAPIEVRLSNARMVYYTNKGVKGIVELPDSTRVWLNSDSRIAYPKQFSGKYREVEFSGEGYFEVHSDSEHPMLIKTTRDFNVEVKGTTFNLRAYNNDNDASTTLVSGSISLYDKSGKKLADMKPKQLANIANGKVYLSQENEVSNQYAWKDGWLIFDNFYHNAYNVKLKSKSYESKSLLKNLANVST